MNETPFRKPHIALNRIYTRKGDSGETALADGQRISKDALRIRCCGAIDELNAFVGMALQSLRELEPQKPSLSPLGDILGRIQHELFNLGSMLATLPEDLHPRQPRVTQAETVQLENEIDHMNEGLPPLSSFILPGGCRLNAELHVCRTVCRRAETQLVALSRTEPVQPEALCYLNRLSDAFFVFSRWASRELGEEEVLWQPNRAASAQSK